MQKSRLRNFEVWHENSKEYHSLKREIFGEDIYYVELDRKDPVIFDVYSSKALMDSSKEEFVEND